jgi:hypothetical protein
MTIFEIKLAGHIKKGQMTPECFATIHRVPGNDYITVSINSPDGDREHLVQAGCTDDGFSMAQCLQERLDGYKGTNSEVHDYFRMLQQFMD